MQRNKKIADRKMQIWEQKETMRIYDNNKIASVGFFNMKLDTCLQQQSRYDHTGNGGHFCRYKTNSLVWCLMKMPCVCLPTPPFYSTLIGLELQDKGYEYVPLLFELFRAISTLMPLYYNIDIITTHANMQLNLPLSIWQHWTRIKPSWFGIYSMCFSESHKIYIN